MKYFVMKRGVVTRVARSDRRSYELLTYSDEQAFFTAELIFEIAVLSSALMRSRKHADQSALAVSGSDQLYLLSSYLVNEFCLRKSKSIEVGDIEDAVGGCRVNTSRTTLLQAECFQH